MVKTGGFKNYFSRMFTRREALGLGLILVVLSVVMALNFSVSERKARDAQRKQDVRDIANALEAYKNDLGSYPVSENGKIVGCDTGKKDNLGMPILRACNWGEDYLGNPLKPDQTKYLERIPVDPRNSDGYKYYYLTDGRFFQLYASLEGTDEAEYSPAVIARNIFCGVKVCNFGLASSHTPLDKSIEEYENELDEALTAPAKK